jgi:hypothetical protein
VVIARITGLESI